MSSKLTKHRQCDEFRRLVLGTMAFLEWLQVQLTDDTQVWSTHDLYFKTALAGPHDLIRGFLNAGQDQLEFFVDNYPMATDLLDTALDLDDSLDNIRDTRFAIIQPHIDAATNQLQVIEHIDPGVYSTMDRAAMNGLDETQQATLESQINRLGYLIVTMTERQTLADAIATELSRFTD